MARKTVNQEDLTNEAMDEAKRGNDPMVEEKMDTDSDAKKENRVDETVTLTRSELQAIIDDAIRRNGSCTGATDDAGRQKDEVAAAEADARSKELVKILLPYDGRRYKDPVFVAINGKSFRIERGVEVEVPRYVAETLRNSQEQDAAFMQFAKENQNRKMSMDEV